MYLDSFLVVYLPKKREQKYDCGCRTCMIVWVREPKKSKLTRIEPKPEPKFDLEKMAGQDRKERALNEIF